MSDGAGLALVGAEGAGGKPRARIVAWAEAGGDPAESLTAGFTAMLRVLGKAKLTLSDLDRIEFMEAFGVTIVKFMRELQTGPRESECRRRSHGERPPDGRDGRHSALVTARCA